MHVVYTLFETNADLEEVRELCSSQSHDIMETKAWMAFKDSYYVKDFMIYSTKDSTIETLLSEKTKQLRNECQG